MNQQGSGARPPRRASAGQRPRGGQELLFTRELTDFGHALARALDVRPADDSLTVDQELSNELRPMVPRFCPVNLGRLEVVETVERIGDLHQRYRFWQFAGRIDPRG